MSRKSLATCQSVTVNEAKSAATSIRMRVIAWRRDDKILIEADHSLIVIDMTLPQSPVRHPPQKEQYSEVASSGQLYFPSKLSKKLRHRFTIGKTSWKVLTSSITFLFPNCLKFWEKFRIVIALWQTIQSVETHMGLYTLSGNYQCRLQPIQIAVCDVTAAWLYRNVLNRCIMHKADPQCIIL